MSIIKLEVIPFDHVFDTENGEELCHATGYEGDGMNEYVDSNGNLHYGN